MRRRAYLATAAAVTFAGCSALDDSETADESDDSDDDPESDDSTEEEQTPESDTFDDFEDLSAWTAVEGSLTADEERSVVGSQSARLETDPGEDRVMILREFDEPRDFSDEVPALALTSETDVAPTVRLTDEEGDRLRFRCAVDADGPFVHRDLGLTEVDGDPDLTSIADVKITVYAADREITAWCDDLRFVDRPDTGTVLLQFPRSAEAVATDAAPILADHDYPATTFVTTDYVGSEGYLSVSQLESLQDDGWTVASAGATNVPLPEQSEADVEDQLERAADWLAEHDFEDGYFAYPQNRYDETALELVEAHHDLAFVGGHTGHGAITNPHLVPQAVDPDAAEATQLLEWAADYGAIATLSYYDLSGGTLADFEAAVSTIAELESAGDLEVATPDDLASDHLH